MNINFLENHQLLFGSKTFQTLRATILIFLLVSTHKLHAQDSKINSLYEKYDSVDIPGIAISVNKDGKNIYQKGFGMANLEYRIPITTQTKFHVASLSKQFTAFLILTLQDKGLLGLEDDVRKFIPELPDYGYKITINHLLTHSSGIRDQWRLLEMAGWRLDDVIKTEQVFRLILNQKELNFEPGKKVKYSNSGYTILAIIVERLTKKTFAEYAKEVIFNPLQMNDSFFYDDHEVMIPNRAYSYKKDNEQLKKSNLNYATVGPTSLFTTIEDFNKWAHNFHTMTIGKKTIFKSMEKEEKDGFAKGQFIRNYKGHKMIYHSGSDAGYRLYFARFPKLGYDFTVFANASYISAYREIMKLIDYYLKDQYPKSKNEKEPNETLFRYNEDSFITLSNDKLKSYEGRYYDNESKDFWIVELKKDTLRCYGEFIGQTVNLLPVGKSNFKIKGTPYDISVNFKENDYKESILEFRIPDLAWLWLEKEIKVNTSDYLGSYFNSELNTRYSLIKKNNELYLTHQKRDDLKVFPVNDAYFVTENRNFANIRFKRNDTGKVVSFSVKNGGVQKITFIKE